MSTQINEVSVGGLYRLVEDSYEIPADKRPGAQFFEITYIQDIGEDVYTDPSDYTEDEIEFFRNLKGNPEDFDEKQFTERQLVRSRFAECTISGWAPAGKVEKVIKTAKKLVNKAEKHVAVNVEFVRIQIDTFVDMRTAVEYSLR